MFGYDYDLINTLLLLVLTGVGLFLFYSFMKDKIAKQQGLVSLMNASPDFASEIDTRRAAGKKIRDVVDAIDLIVVYFTRGRVDEADASNDALNLRRQLNRERQLNRDNAQELNQLRDLAKEMKKLIRDLQRNNTPSTARVKELEAKLEATQASNDKTHEALMGMINK